MRKIIIAGTLILLGINPILSQGTRTKGKSAEDSLKIAEKAFKEGRSLVLTMWKNERTRPLLKARKLFKTAAPFWGNTAEYHQNLARLSFLDTLPITASQHIDTARMLGLELKQTDWYILAKGAHLSSDFPRAEQAYLRFLKEPTGAYGRRYERNAIQSLKQVQYAQKTNLYNRKAKEDTNITVMPATREFTALLRADAGEQFFIRVREKESPKKPQSSKKEMQWKWIRESEILEEIMPAYLCSPTLYPISLSPDGNKVLLHHISSKGISSLWISERYDDVFLPPIPLPEPINQVGANQSQGCFGATHRELYFISDRAGGMGGKDIYYTFQHETGMWAVPRNLGAPINTAGNEYSVFIHPDGKHLYFSSDGHPTVGGADIFQSIIKLGKFSEVINLGFPINTPYDDLHFNISANGKVAMMNGPVCEFSGTQKRRKVYLLGSERQPAMLVPYRRFALWEELGAMMQENEETCYDCATVMLMTLNLEIPENTSFVGGKIRVFDLSLGTPLYAHSFGPREKSLRLVLPAGKSYGYSLLAEHFYPYFGEIELPVGQAFSEVEEKVVLKNIQTATQGKLPLIFFVEGKTTLAIGASAGLYTLLEFLTDNPGKKIRLGMISAHSDALLQSERLLTIKNYLLEMGFPSTLLGEDLETIIQSDTPRPFVYFQLW
jgi:hypothetical protein